MKRLLTILLFLPCFCQASIKIYMDAVNGNDANTNTASTPWQTLTKLNSQTLSGGDTVFFKRGTGQIFYGRANWTRTGAAGNPVVYTTYGTGAEPIITGYTTLSTWTNNGGGIYAAPAPGVKQYAHNLLMDGQLQTIARYPNTGFIAFTPGSTTSITTSEASPGTHTNDSIVVRSSRYTLDHAKITAQAGSTYTISAVTYSGAGGIGFFYFNDPKYLDTLGEWCVNSTLDSVYVYFGGGGPTGHTVQVSTVDTLVYATGAYIKAIHIQMVGGNMYNFLNPFGGGNIYLDTCAISDGYNGIGMRSWHDTVRACPITDILNNGVNWPSNNITKYSALIGNTALRVGMLPGMGASGTENYEGFHVPAQGAYIYHNYLKNIGYHGIYTTFDSFVVRSNIVDSAGRSMSDGAGIYSWDQNSGTYTFRIIDSNVVMHGVAYTAGTVVDPGTMFNGIYTDGKARHITISNNYCISNSGPGYFNHGDSMIYTNDRGYDNGLSQMQHNQFSGQPITGIVVINCLFACPDTSKALLFLYSPNTVVTGFFTTIDSNYYATTNAVAPFQTQQSGGSIVKRSLSSWQSFLSSESHSSHRTGTLSEVHNINFSAYNQYFRGRYINPAGAAFNQLAPLGPCAGEILLLQDKGYVDLAPGTKIKAH